MLSLKLLSDPVNDCFACTHRVTATPTYIVFGLDGQEIRRWVNREPELDELPRSVTSNDVSTNDQ